MSVAFRVKSSGLSGVRVLQCFETWQVSTGLTYIWIVSVVHSRKCGWRITGGKRDILVDIGFFPHYWEKEKDAGKHVAFRTC